MGFIFFVYYFSIPITYKILSVFPSIQRMLPQYISFPFHLFIYKFLNFSIVAIVVIILFNKVRLFERLHYKYNTLKLLIAGNICVLFHIFCINSIYILLKTDIGRYFLNYNKNLNLTVKILLMIACFRVLIGIKPIETNKNNLD